MEYKVELLNKAKFELADAVDWYNKSRPGLGVEFAKAINNKLLMIEKYPKRYRIVKRAFRQVSTEKFPYCIIYYIINKENKIIIFSIFLHRRNPKSKFRL